MERIILELHGETRYSTRSGEKFSIPNSFLRCYISTDLLNKLKLRIDVHQTENTLFTSVTIFQGPGPLKYLKDDFESQCAQGGFKLNLITSDTLKFKAKDPDNPKLILFGKLLLKMKRLKHNLDEPFGMTVHDMSLGDMCSAHNSENTYKRKPYNWANNTKSSKENNPNHSRKSFPLANRNGVMNRAKTWQSVQLPARKSIPNVQVSNKGTFNRNSDPLDLRNLDSSKSLQTTPSHIRFARDPCDANKASSQQAKRVCSSSPSLLSLKETIPNVVAASTPERNIPQFYGNRSPSLNLVPLRSPNLVSKRACSPVTGTDLFKKVCNSPNGSENKENQNDSTVNYNLRKEGLANLGNTCYMNASLQAVFQFPSFVKAMIGTFYEVQDDLDDNSSFGAITSLMIERNCSSTYSYNQYRSCLVDIKEAIDFSCKNFIGNGMQDVQEFLNKLMCTMKEEISAVIVKSKKDSLINPVDSYFKMTLNETMTCSKCGNEVKKSQDAYDIALQVPNTSAVTLQTALETTFAEELRDLTCEQCSHNQCTTTTTISCLPKILTIFIKRYKFSEGQIVKDKTLINVPDFLTLEKFVEKQGQEPVQSDCRSIDSTESNNVTSSVPNHEFQIGGGGDNQEISLTSDISHSYRLKSAICHSGDVKSGHYVCYGIDIGRQRCKLFDDSNVENISMNKVSTVLKEEGYLFIYEKLSA